MDRYVSYISPTRWSPVWIGKNAHLFCWIEPKLGFDGWRISSPIAAIMMNKDCSAWIVTTESGSTYYLRKDGFRAEEDTYDVKERYLINQLCVERGYVYNKAMQDPEEWAQYVQSVSY